MGFWDDIKGGLETAWDYGTPAGLAYTYGYKKPADKQKAALQTAQGQAMQEADYNRQLQLEGLNRAESFYGPARDVLSQMLGGTPPGGYGMTTQGPTSLPKPPSLPGSPAADASQYGGWTAPPPKKGK